MLGVHHFLQHVQAPATVALEAHLILGLHRIFLPAYILRIKFRGNKKLREAIQGLRQKLLIDIKEIIGVLKAGIGITPPPVLCGVLLVLCRIGVFLRAQKQHMLQKMSQTTPPGRVIPTTNHDIQRASRLPRIGIGNQQHLQFIFQHKEPVLVFVIGALCRGQTSAGNGGAGHKNDSDNHT